MRPSAGHRNCEACAFSARLRPRPVHRVMLTFPKPMRFARAVISRCLAVALASVLATGCVPPREASDTVVIWHQKSGEERELFEGLIRTYNESHTDERVTALYRQPEELRNTFIIAAAAGQGPDLVFSPADDIALFSETRVIRPWNEVVGESFLSRFTKEGIVSWKGQPWMIADQVGNQLMLVYDRQAVGSPPRTLSELAAFGANIALARDGRSDRYALVWDYGEPYCLIPFLTGFGGWIIDDNGNPTLDTPQMRDALAFIADLRDKYGAIPRADDRDTAGIMFLNRRAAMIMSGPWSWADYGVPGRSMLALLPVNTVTGLRCRPIVAAKGYCLNINTRSEKFGIVARVLAHLTSGEAQWQMASRLFTLPTLEAVVSSPAFARDPVLKLALEQAKHSMPMPITPKLRDIWDAMREPCRQILGGDLTPGEAARLMQVDAERRIAESMP